MFEYLLKNARVVDPLNNIDDVCDVAIEDGKIARVSPEITGKAKEEIDLKGLVLQPGIIDSHVHLGTMWGSPYGHKMLAKSGVTTALDMAGPLDDVLDHIPQYGAGLNVAILQFASPPFTFKTNAPTRAEMDALIDKSMEEGALGVKLLGGHYPLTPAVSSELIDAAAAKGAYIAWHAGTSENGSNIKGMAEAVKLAAGRPLHLAHINAYCRGAVKNDMAETEEAIALLKANPNIACESYVSPKNGTRLTCNPDGGIQSKVTGNCLRHYGYSEDKEGVRAALLAGKAFAVYESDGMSDLVTGAEAVKLWEAHNTDVGGSFNINPPLPRIALSQAKRDDGSFVVDAISTDGGCIPRNVLVSQGLSLVKLDILSLPQYVQKTSLNPARMLRLANKGHLSVGADADITIYDYERQVAVHALVGGRFILRNGDVCGKSATIIATERASQSIAKRGLRMIEVNPSEAVVRSKAV